MLILKENIGSGRHRRCYQHPFDSQKCVKTLYNPDDGGLKEVKRETRYYRKKNQALFRHARPFPTTTVKSRPILAPAMFLIWSPITMGKFPKAWPST